MNIINHRRSIRTFDNKAIKKSDIEALLRAGMQAPSAKNQQPWEFIVVEDKNMLKVLSETTRYSKLLASASMGIVVMANSNRFIEPDFWQQDLAAATQNIMLEAVHLGLGTCWLGIAPFKDNMDKVASAFSLPKHYLPFSLIAIGHLSKHTNQFRDRYDPSKVHFENI